MSSEPKAVAWFKGRPTKQGAYYIRGFNLGRRKRHQYEALVQVRWHKPPGASTSELVCNLHESTSNENLDDWLPIKYMSSAFEWRGPLCDEQALSALRAEVEAWRTRLPAFEFRPMDDVVALKQEFAMEQSA